MKRAARWTLLGLAAGVVLLHGWLLDALSSVATRREGDGTVDHRARATAALPAVAVLAVSLASVAPAAAVEVEPSPPPLVVQRAQAAPAVASVPSATPRAAKASAPREPARAVTARPPASAIPAPAAAPPDAGAPYRTRIPPSEHLSYRLSRGPIVGSGEIDWQVSGAGYMLRLEGSVPIIGSLIVQTSRGGFDAAGLAPLRYTDKRLRRGEKAANFQRDAGKLSFSGSAEEQPLLPGMQDRLSVMLQLSAIANAWAAPPPAGTVLQLTVAGARGDVNRWSLRYEGIDKVVSADGATVRALRFLREPESAFDTRAEFWLDPTLSCLPVKARFTDGSNDPLELLRSGHVP